MAELFTLKLSNKQNYPYFVVHSKRAKYIRIKLSQQGELSVTLPLFTKIKLAHEFIDSKRSWIEKNLSKVKNIKEQSPPSFLDLKLVNESWSIEYIETDDLDNALQIKESDNFVLIISGKSNQLKNINLVSKILNQWCKEKAKTIFNEMLQNLAELHGFHYRLLTIRSQKTRWGSCSQNKNISLNSKLLFMPYEVVRYVMIHELCHTVEMNHSSQFWNLVQDCDPKYVTYKNQLKNLSRSVVI